MRLSSAALSDVGRKRETNQDAFLINEEINLFVVADGMGGHAGGEMASKLAVETIEKNLLEAKHNSSAPFGKKANLPESSLPDHFREAVEAACHKIFHEAKQNPHLQGMGTTVSALLLDESGKEGSVDAYLAHVGDSRIYLVRGSILQQVSEDHSLVNEQIKAGVITAEDAKQSRFKNIITRSVGFEEDVLVDVMGLWAQKDDVFVMCSDGLSNLIEEQEILEHVRSHEGEKFQELPKALVELANSRGGDDNITILLVRVEET